MMIHFRLSTEGNDIETVSFVEKLKEEIYIECFPSMKGIGKEYCIILDKCIYGLVQEARQYNKKVLAILIKVGFIGGNVDPCIYMKKSANCIVYVALYADDKKWAGAENIKKSMRQSLM